jgi:hypothetical protein
MDGSGGPPTARVGHMAWLMAGAERPLLPGRGLRGPPPDPGRGQRPYRLASRRVVAAGAQVQIHPAALPIDLIDLPLSVLEGE